MIISIQSSSRDADASKTIVPNALNMATAAAALLLVCVAKNAFKAG
jgi:hypothetical protein